MKLSTKGQYGVIAMLDLALHYTGSAQSIKNIANRQNLSDSYLEQIFRTLRKSGLIKSIRGAQGGYCLGDTPSNISVGMILYSLEGSLAPVKCIDEKNIRECTLYSGCVTKIIWTKMRDELNKVVDNITLEQLVENYNKINNTDEYMYYI